MSTNVRKATGGHGDDIVCYCVGMTRAEILDSVTNRDTSFEAFVDRTGVGTQCAACRLNVEVLVGEVYAESARHLVQAKRTRLMVPANQYNCGYFLGGKDRETVLRISNPALPNTQSEVPLADYHIAVDAFDAFGGFVGSHRTGLDAGDDMTFSLNDISGLPEFGWFTVDIVPRTTGFVGNVRPQVAIRKGDHCSTYHMQLARDASKRRTIMIDSVGGRSSTRFALINMQRKPAKLTVGLESIDEPLSLLLESTIPARGAVLFDVDEAFDDLPDNSLMIAAVETDIPIRRYFYVEHADGSLSMDHFPNTR